MNQNQIESDIKALKNLGEIQDVVKEKYKNIRLQKQELQKDLEEVYKPIITSQTKSTEEIKKATEDSVIKIENSSNARWDEFKNKFSDFPKAITLLEEIRNEVRNDSALNTEKLDTILKNLEKKPSLVRKIDEGDVEDLDEYELKTISDMGDLAKSIAGAEAESVTPSGKTKTPLEYVSQDEVDKLTEFMNDKEALKEFVGYTNVQSNLIARIRANPNTNLSSNPWVKIRSVNPGFYDRLKATKVESMPKTPKTSKTPRSTKTPKTPKVGTGLQIKPKKVSFANEIIIPSSKKDLFRELARLMGSYDSGNTGVFNELNDVVDELRRKGLISIEDSKKIFKNISNVNE